MDAREARLKAYEKIESGDGFATVMKAIEDAANEGCLSTTSDIKYDERVIARLIELGYVVHWNSPCQHFMISWALDT